MNSPAMHGEQHLAGVVSAYQFDHMGEAVGHIGHSVIWPSGVLVLAYLLNSESYISGRDT